MQKPGETSHTVAESPQLGPENETQEPRELASQDVESAEEQKGQSTEDIHVTGLKFALLLAGITLVGFLFLLDVSIVATVCL